MKTFLWTVSSSNEKSLNNFLKLFKKTFKNKQINIVKTNRFLNNKEIVTLLTSPHVNKTAQEHFEKRKKSVQIILISENFNKTVINVKKVFNKLFSNVKLTIKYSTNNTSNKTNALNVLKITNFKFNSLKKPNVNKKLQINKALNHLYLKKKSITFKTYLKILNSYGEIVL